MNSQSNDQQVNEDQEFNDIAKALSAGDHSSLDRLMTVEDKKKPDDEGDSAPDDTESGDEGEVEENQEEEDKPQEGDGDEPIFKDDDDPDSSEPDKKEPANKEAAPSAASTASKDNEDLQQELHRLRSDAGRVPFLQRRLADLERELRATKARTPTPSNDGKTPAAPADLSSIELDAETQKDIEELRAIDPALASTLERMHKKAIFAANSRADHVVNTLTEAEREAEENRFFMEQKAELTRMIPQHEQIFALPEWRQWKETLTPGQRALAESGYASEVGQAIYAFAADMQRRQAAAVQTQQPAAVSTPPAKTEVSQARSRKIDATADVRNSAAKADEQIDEDQLFRELYNKVGKENHIL